MRIEVLVDVKTILGEGPLWDVEEQRLYWIDSTAAEISSCRADGSDCGPMLNRGAQIVIVIECNEPLASLDRAPQEGPHPALRLQLRLLASQTSLPLLPRSHTGPVRSGCCR